MQLVCSGRSHNADMAAGAFPILRAIAVLEQVEFPHRIYPEGLAARAVGPARLARGIRADVLHAVDRKRIFFRPPAHYGKVVALVTYIGSVVDPTIAVPTLTSMCRSVFLRITTPPFWN